MNTAVVNFRTTPTTKQLLTAMADNAGLSTSSFLNMLVLEASKKKTLEISLEPTPYLQKIMKQTNKEIAQGLYDNGGMSPEAALSVLDQRMKQTKNER